MKEYILRHFESLRLCAGLIVVLILVLYVNTKIHEKTAARGRFLTNMYDPRKPKARMYHTYSFHTWDSGKEAMDTEWQHHLDYVARNVICPPKATEKYTQKQLEDMNMVGIYAPADSK